MLTAGFIKTLSFSARGLRRLASTIATVARNRAALNKLNELDERTLADIGLTRGDIISASAVPMRSDPFLIDPFDARRRVHASELEALARWPRPLPEQPYVAGRTGQSVPECIAAE
ncbi:DUF1127 domain-containing protein [uncultured Cohaesibacter sp.]|uniref:DUF1127 domain-containing protein n=1 Tax=uncultured Cohaesibacter sp. TaxID=1002546 RepID=UPI0029C6F5C7|nr:DUF1127 domain-containing protein [uncultured Cohaesibacter sp.]